MYAITLSNEDRRVIDRIAASNRPMLDVRKALMSDETTGDMWFGDATATFKCSFNVLESYLGMIYSVYITKA